MLHEWPVPFLLALVNMCVFACMCVQSGSKTMAMYICAYLMKTYWSFWLPPSGLAPMPKGVELILVQVKPRAEKGPAALTQEHCTLFLLPGRSSLGALDSVMSFGDHSSHIPGLHLPYISLRRLA